MLSEEEKKLLEVMSVLAFGPGKVEYGGLHWRENMCSWATSVTYSCSAEIVWLGMRSLNDIVIIPVCTQHIHFFSKHGWEEFL